MKSSKQYEERGGSRRVPPPLLPLQPVALTITLDLCLWPKGQQPGTAFLWARWLSEAPGLPTEYPSLSFSEKWAQIFLDSGNS